MSRTNNTDPYWVQRFRAKGIRPTAQELDVLNRRRRCPYPYSPRTEDGVNYENFEERRKWYKEQQEKRQAILDKYDLERWPSFPYGYGAPKWFRTSIKRARKAKERDLIAQERYDDIPKWKRDAAWLFW